MNTLFLEYIYGPRYVNKQEERKLFYNSITYFIFYGRVWSSSC